jgi:hypothetical protein
MINPTGENDAVTAPDTMTDLDTANADLRGQTHDVVERAKVPSGPQVLPIGGSSSKGVMPFVAAPVGHPISTART